MLKVILSYMDSQTQKSMAIYIKFLELNYTIDYFRKHPCPLSGCTEKETSPDILKMCSELLPYCTESERKQIEQIRGVLQSMEMYKEMSKTMEMMKDFMPDMAAFMNSPPMEDSFAENYSTENDSALSKEDCPDDNKDDSPSSPSEDSSGQAGSFDMMNMLMNMLTPEQKQMFEMFGGNQHAQ